MDNSAPFDPGEELLKMERDNEVGAAEYDCMTARQIAERNRRPQKIDQAAEIQSALIVGNLDAIRFWQEDIGALVAVREGFPRNERLHDMTKHLIRLEMKEIEDLTMEVEKWRKEN
ncbi:MAG: hypothetical protein HPY65_18960 [Syntrophaceae bacterium]|nr:hypothetical protein [Syntrophaceae bacterium]